MQAERITGEVELQCSWCGASVPLPAGDYSSVCIDCGTVMFRHAWYPAQLPRPEFEQCIRSIEDHIGHCIGKSASLPVA